MKLQYLGDSRDAFKWDLLHWLCTRAEPAFARLILISLLTADGRRLTADGRFPCRPLIRPFVAGLAAAPRSLERIAALAGIEDGHPLEVTVAQADAFVEEGARRASYWDWCHPERYADTLVFLDPDNGFETRTQRRPKWVRHAEVQWLLERLPESAAVAVYQHRPRRRWDDLFADLAPRRSDTARGGRASEPSPSVAARAAISPRGARRDTARLRDSRCGTQQQRECRCSGRSEAWQRTSCVEGAYALRLAGTGRPTATRARGTVGETSAE